MFFQKILSLQNNNQNKIQAPQKDKQQKYQEQQRYFSNEQETFNNQYRDLLINSKQQSIQQSELPITMTFGGNDFGVSNSVKRNSSNMQASGFKGQLSQKKQKNGYMDQYYYESIEEQQPYQENYVRQLQNMQQIVQQDLYGTPKLNYQEEKVSQMQDLSNKRQSPKLSQKSSENKSIKNQLKMADIQSNHSKKSHQNYSQNSNHLSSGNNYGLQNIKITHKSSASIRSSEMNKYYSREYSKIETNKNSVYHASKVQSQKFHSQGVKSLNNNKKNQSEELEKNQIQSQKGSSIKNYSQGSRGAFSKQELRNSNTSSKQSVEQMVKKLKNQIKLVKQQISGEGNTSNRMPIEQKFTSPEKKSYERKKSIKQQPNQGFIDHFQNQISQIKSRQIQNQYYSQKGQAPHKKIQQKQFYTQRNNKSKNSEKNSQQGSLIQCLEDEQGLINYVRNSKKLLEIQPCISGLKQKLEITPSFNRDINNTGNSGDIVNEEIQQKNLTQKLKRQIYGNNWFKNHRYEGGSDLTSTPPLTLYQRSNNGTASITQIIKREVPSQRLIKKDSIQSRDISQIQTQIKQNQNKVPYFQQSSQLSNKKASQKSSLHISGTSNSSSKKKFQKPPSFPSSQKQQQIKSSTKPLPTKLQNPQQQDLKSLLRLSQQQIKNLSSQLYNQRKKTQKLEQQLKILSIQKNLIVQSSQKLQNSIADFIMNNSNGDIESKLNSNILAELLQQFRMLRKQSFKYQQCIFDLEQQNTRLKESREEQFKKMKLSIQNQCKQRFNIQFKQSMGNQIQKRVLQAEQKIAKNKNIQFIKLQSYFKQQLNTLSSQLKSLQQKELRASQTSKQKQREIEQISQKLQLTKKESEKIIQQNIITIKELKQMVKENQERQNIFQNEINQRKNQIFLLTKEIQEQKSQLEQQQIKIFCLEEQLMNLKEIQTVSYQANQQKPQNKQQTKKSVKFSPSHTMSQSLQQASRQQEQSIIHNLDAFKSSNQIKQTVPSDNFYPTQSFESVQNRKMNKSRANYPKKQSMDPQLQNYIESLYQELQQRQYRVREQQSLLIEKQKGLILKQQSIYRHQLKIQSELRKLQMKRQSLKLQEDQIMGKYQEIRKKQIIATQEKFGLGRQVPQRTGQYGLRKGLVSAQNSHARSPRHEIRIEESQQTPVENTNYTYQRPQKDVSPYHQNIKHRAQNIEHTTTRTYQNSNRYHPQLNLSRAQRSRSNSIQAQKILRKLKSQGSITKRCKCNNQRSMCCCDKQGRITSRELIISANRKVKISPPKQAIQKTSVNTLKQAIKSSYYTTSPGSIKQVNTKFSPIDKLNTPSVSIANRINKQKNFEQRCDNSQQKSIKLKIIEDKVKRIRSEAGLGQKM